MDLVKKSKKYFILYKVDFEKACDSVSWYFLDYMLSIFGSNDKWWSWIRACMFSGNLEVLINGFLTQEINIQRGLKQGGGLAPFHFLLVTVAEGLSGLISRTVELHLLLGVIVESSELVVSHLQYTDDTIILVDSTVVNLWTIKAILHGFELASGLRVNFINNFLIGVILTTIS